MASGPGAVTTVATDTTPAGAARQDRERRIFAQLLWAVGLGILLGLFFGESVAPFRIVGDGFIRLLQVTVLPYLLGSILAGLGRRTPKDARRLAVRGGIVLAAFWAMALAIVAATSLAYPARQNPDSFFSPDVAAAPPVDWLSLYIPSNLFSSLSNNVLPAVVLFGLLAGTALGSMEGSHKAALLGAIEAFNEAMSRIARALVRVTPLGVLAITTTTAGLMRPEQLVRLQLWFVVYISSACILSFWVLPGLVALLTPVPYGRFVRRFRSALVTAFAAGDLFIVLPIITEEGKELLKEQGVSAENAEATMGVVVPLLFNFPHTGKILSLAFLPFAAWFSGISLSLGQWWTLASAGLLTMFGSLTGAIPFLLDLLKLPADLFGLFSMSSVLNSRFGSLVAAVHTAALAIVIAIALTRGLRIQWKRLAWFAAVTVLLVGAVIGGTRAVFAIVLPDAPSGAAALEGFRMRAPFTDAVVTRGAHAPPVRPVVGHRLAEISDRQVLRVGVLADSVPYAFYNAAGELIGYDIEMANVLAHDLNVSVEFVETTRERLDDDLASGVCDIIMCGYQVSLNRSRRAVFSRPYEQERLGFLVPDYDRTRFANLDAIQDQPLRIGIQAIDDLAPIIRQRLRAAEFVRFPSIDALIRAVPGTVRAAVLPIDRAFYSSRVRPELSAVLPEEMTSSVMLAYAMPAGELEFQNVIDSWIDVKRGQGAFESARNYWVRGEGLRPQQRRWSFARNVLGWRW
jgi:Na+/H+-dicarboxylate symporter/ABC-type amino acid transport substrate-binding protein